MGRNKRNRRRKSRKGGSAYQQALTGKSYKGQQRVRIVIPGVPQNLVSTVTTGVLAYADKFDPTVDVEDWSTRFLNTFEEYRIVAVTARLVASGGVAGSTSVPGVSKVWFDEKYFSTPGFGESTAKTTVTLAHSAQKRQKTEFHWRASDLADLNWNATVSSPTGTASFKVYTDNTHYNAPIVASSLWIYQAFYTLEFRGIEEQ